MPVTKQPRSHPPTVSALTATYRHGQIFLTWNEQETLPGTTFKVYQHEKPITAVTLARARQLAHHIERHSARDWWQDPVSFDGAAAPGTPAGFRIAAGAKPLDPSSGLFVHTVTPESQGARFYAVTSTSPDGVEDKRLVAGQNSLTRPVSGSVALAQPIWLGEGPGPQAGEGKKRSLILSLHGRGGGVTAGADARPVNCLVFGDARHGWREGLAFKFQLRIDAHVVWVTPCDRSWTGGRPVLESKDRRDHCPAVSTFWYGYHDRIYETTRTATATAPNYIEEYLLWIVRWAQSHLGADPNHAYLCGGSMGGSGAISMALHHPHVFAAVDVYVPIYSYTRPGSGSAQRLECVCGSLARPVVTRDGIPLLEHMDGARIAEQTQADLPYIFSMNGRRDASIPWENNPPFYKAMNRARQGLSVYWNNGGHGMQQEAPTDVRAWGQRLCRFRLDQSFPAFSNCSDDRDCGNGDPANGDLVGWINRGLDWTDLVDTTREYALTVTADHPDLVYPVVVDVTPRRIQKFKPAPGAPVQVSIGQQPPEELRADSAGRITIRSVRINSRAGTRIRLTR